MEELFEDEGVDEEFEIEGLDQEDIVDSDFDQSSADEEPQDDEELNLPDDPDEAKARKKHLAMMNHLKTGKSSFTIPTASSSSTVTTTKTLPGRSKSSRQTVHSKKDISSSSKRSTTSAAGSTVSTPAATASPGPSNVPLLKIPAEIRKSSRRTTIINKQETELKLLEYETRKAMQPKREKAVVHKMTQEELLEEAKKTEALNLASLQAFKAQELEKKKVVKKTGAVMDHFVRYHSFGEWVGHGPLIQALADSGPATPGGTRPPTRPGSRIGSRRGSTSGSLAPEVSQYGHNLAHSLAQSLLQHQKDQSSVWPRDSSGDVEMTSPDNTDKVRRKNGGLGGDTSGGTLTPANWSTMHMSAGSIARKRKKLHHSQMCGRNWITFVGYEEDDSPISDWSYAENYPEKKPMCVITGLPAKYKDPKTGVPYANKEAYKILQNVVHHGYVWSNGLNAYCHDVAQPLPKGVPAGMAEAIIGGQQVGDGIVLKDGELVSGGVHGGGGGGYTYRRRQIQKPSGSGQD
ncbi:Vacuolar protein sorting-associated protein 72 [Entomortierella beljakovae]|nr:Vacuolar protein sorting-associated protein 72 [Entomortierella beljakovae]